MLKLIVSDFFFDDLPKQERQQLLVILRLSEIFPEALEKIKVSISLIGKFRVSCSTHPFERTLDRRLLGADEAADHNRDCKVNIICSHVLAEVHLRARLRHSDHTFEMTHGYRYGAGRK